MGNSAGDELTSWANETSLLVGLLSITTGAHLAAVYLGGWADGLGIEVDWARDPVGLLASDCLVLVKGIHARPLAMTEAVLRRLGATPDQIDRERARVREELMPIDQDTSRV